MSAGVFICHAFEDAKLAAEMVQILEAAGTRCWIAPRDISPGADYPTAIAEALGVAPAVVLVFSGAANLSAHVPRELNIAVNRRAPLLPLRVEEVDPTLAMGYLIGASQWLDTFDVPVETWGQTLVDAIERLIGPSVDTPPVVAPPPTSLPAMLGPTFGRDALVADVCALLERDGLVTLTGPGGVGKTRLASEAAQRIEGLVVLDGATPTEAPPSGVVLATSRTPLGLPGERVVPVPPLDPASAAALFEEVAGRMAPRVTLDPVRVAEVCRLVGELPLGVEMAASRLRLVGIDRLASSLGASLDLVAGFRDALAESLERLDPDAQQLLGRLSLLRGPVSLETVESVAGVPDPADALGLLVDAGLVLLRGDAEISYVVPQPVRLLAMVALEDGGDAEAARDAAASNLATRLDGWRRRLDTPRGPEVSEEFSVAAPEVEAAVAAAVGSGQLDTAYRLLESAKPLWLDIGRSSEPLALCEQLLDRLAAGDPRTARVHAMLGRFAYQLTDWQLAERELRTAWQLGENLGDQVAVLDARIYLSGILLMQGQLEEGTALADQVHAETQQAGLYPQTAEGLFMVALSHGIAGDLAGEREAHLRRLEVVRAHGDLPRTADELNTLAEIALDEDDPGSARRYADEVLKISADRLPVMHRDASITMVRALAALGDLAAAGRTLAEAIVASQRLGQSLAIAQCLRAAAVLAEAGGDPALAIRLFAGAEKLSPSPSRNGEPPEAHFAEALGRARAALDEHAQESEWTLGGALPMSTMLAQLDQAIGLVGS